MLFRQRAEPIRRSRQASGEKTVPMNRDDNKLVFVSYAHADKKFIDRELMPFLSQLELGEQIELWHDQLIGTGDNWYAEIADRLDHAKVAIGLKPSWLGVGSCRYAVFSTVSLFMSPTTLSSQERWPSGIFRTSPRRSPRCRFGSTGSWTVRIVKPLQNL